MYILFVFFSGTTRPWYTLVPKINPLFQKSLELHYNCRYEKNIALRLLNRLQQEVSISSFILFPKQGWNSMEADGGHFDLRLKTYEF